MNEDENDYTITWCYIVKKMMSIFRVKPNDNTPISMGEIERRMDAIWDVFLEEKAKSKLEKQKEKCDGFESI